MKQTSIAGSWVIERGRQQALAVKGEPAFEEESAIISGVKYRVWDPRRSKLAAAIVKGAPISIPTGSKILYLGASHGYTVSFLSDCLGGDGLILAVDIAPRVMRDLVFLCDQRKNIVPLLADANQPQLYPELPMFDVLFQDVAQRNQAEILLKNTTFLKKGGITILAIKARSIDITKNPVQIFKETKELIAKQMDVLQMISLEPLEKDHAVIVARKR
ncbi:fibrillarin-like rRNA/tRNA 2'-O-methyltransferase [Candidatus Woesearchaeota archaeon]|nr:fibrillarin-like rRNA/tRNA 2'-O-methyltransferase [Candidatus Woesearchaeota archaeon]